MTTTTTTTATTSASNPLGSELAIDARGLVKQFGSNRAVDGVDLAVPTGSVYGVLGPNGAGKTTTVSMLATLLRPDAGSAKIFGYDVVHDSTAVRSLVGVTGQYASVDEDLTARQNLVVFALLLGFSRKAAKVRADELLDEFALTEAADRPLKDFSGGMRRRLDLAASLIDTPPLLFLDEPTTGLDPRSRHEVWSLVSRLRESGVTTLLTTQYLEEADVLSDSIVVIDHGRVIAEGTSDELKSQTGGTVCEVTPTFAEDIPRLTELLSDLIRRSKDSTQTSEDETDSIAVPAPDGTQTLVEVVRRCTEAKIELSDVVMRKPSLDEVFLDLTAPSQDADA